MGEPFLVLAKKLRYFVLPPGLEPGTAVPKTDVISISLREHIITMCDVQHNTLYCYKINVIQCQTINLYRI